MFGDKTCHVYITKLGRVILGGRLVTFYSTISIVKQQRNNNKVILKEVSNLDSHFDK